jgi:hypothetical protein
VEHGARGGGNSAAASFAPVHSKEQSMKEHFWEYLGFFLANCAVLVAPIVIWGDPQTWMGPAIAMTFLSAVIVPLESKMAAAFERDRFPF